MARAAFALKALVNRFNRERALCPYCQSRFYRFLQRKWVLIEARQCVHCGLIYRWPTDEPEHSVSFYETGYDGQQATDIPGVEELAEHKKNNFLDSWFDKRGRVDFLEKANIPKGRLLDYGCSWGYSMCQYAKAGFDVSGYEIDRNRAAVGRDQLDLDIRSTWAEFEEEIYDVVLCDHSLEHVPTPNLTLEMLTLRTKPGSLLIVFVPNGACEKARRLGVQWGPFIGEAHTMAFTSAWFNRNLPRHAFIPAFYTPEGRRLRGDDYLADQEEIALIARRIG